MAAAALGKCEIVDVSVDDTASYEHMAGFHSVLVPTVQTIQVTGLITPIAAPSYSIPIHEEALPWGLIHSITVHHGVWRDPRAEGPSVSDAAQCSAASTDAPASAGCSGPLPPPLKYSLHVCKSTGTRESPSREVCSSETAVSSMPPPPCVTSMCNGIMVCDQDAVHEDIARVFTLTGHMLRFRAIAAADIGTVVLHFTNRPPSSFYIQCWGFNVATGMSVEAVKHSLLSRMMPPLEFQPIPGPLRRKYAGDMARKLAKEHGLQLPPMSLD